MFAFETTPPVVLRTKEPETSSTLPSEKVSEALLEKVYVIRAADASRGRASVMARAAADRAEVPIRRPLRAEIGAADALADAVAVRTLRIVESSKNYISEYTQVSCQIWLSYEINSL
jgi:hypothetical protein